MDNTVVISTPPHVKSKKTTRGIMIDVCIALLPAAIAGIVFFGVNAFIVELVAVAAAVATEFVWFFIANKGFSGKCKNAGKTCVRWWKQFDFTSVVTGLILALILPSTAKWYEVLIGSIFAIGVVKMLPRRQAECLCSSALQSLLTRRATSQRSVRLKARSSAPTRQILRDFFPRPKTPRPRAILVYSICSSERALKAV